MTGPEHYAEAEQLLEWVAPSAAPEQEAAAVRLAQVHATLALAAATALQHNVGDGMNTRDRVAWHEVAGTRKAGAEARGA